MTFPASQIRLEPALKEVADIASWLRGRVGSVREQSVNIDMPRTDFVALLSVLTAGIDRWDAIAATPGLVAYAQSQYNDNGLDISTEYQAMKAAAVALRLWIFQNIPTQGGAVLERSVNLQGVYTDLTISSASQAAIDFRAQADAFIATIG